MSSEIAPAGGWVQIKVNLDPTIFGTTTAVATFSAAGDTWGSANISSQQVDAQFTSPSGGIGRLPGLPVLTLTVPVLAGTLGTISAITADASQSSWLDGSGNQYAVTVLSGSVTIGGSLSIQNLSPGGGLLPAGTVVKVNGMGFTQSTTVEMYGVSVATTQFVSAQEIDVMLAGAAELTAKRVVLTNPDGSQVQYFSAMPSHPDREPGSGYTTHYMLSLQTFLTGSQNFNIVGGGLVVLQNQNLTPVSVYLQAETAGEFYATPAVTIPAGELYVYSSGELQAEAGIVATASQPIRMLSPRFTDPCCGAQFSPATWAMQGGKPIAQALTPTPAAVEVSWQIGTAAPAPLTVSLVGYYFSSPFTLTSTGAPFIVTPSQGTSVPANISVSVDTAGLTVGTYTGSISVTPVGPSPTTLTIPMSLTVSASPLISVTRTQLFAEYSASNLPQQPTPIGVTSDGNPAAFTAGANVLWLTVTPASGTTPRSISVAVNITGLAVGTYNGQMLVAGAANSVTIPFELVVLPVLYPIPVPSSITFTAQTGNATLDSQVLQATGYGPIVASVSTSSGGSWLTATTQGTSIVVSANQAGLKAGTYTGTVTLTSPVAAITTVGVTLVIYDTLPQLTVTPQTLTFSGPADNIPLQTLTVQSGDVPLNVSLNFSTNNAAVSIFASSQQSQTPATIQVGISAVSSESIATGTYQGSIAISAGGQTVNVPVTATITPASYQIPYFGSIVNAASQIVGSISPGEIITIYGYSVGPFATEGLMVDASGKVVTSLQGAMVLFDGKPAPLIYGSATQLNVMVPYEIASETSTTISLNYAGVASTAWAVPVAPSAPGIFTLAGDGVGPGAVLNQDNSVNSAANPAARGSIVSIYGTGEGQTSPAGVTGSVTGSAVKMPVLPVTVTIGGITGPPQYAGSAPDSIAGLLQVNAVVPQGVATGSSVPITLNIGGSQSQARVTIAVK
jgi:uncharacterized protein (TIGR03437 family)